MFSHTLTNTIYCLSNFQLPYLYKTQRANDWNREPSSVQLAAKSERMKEEREKEKDWKEKWDKQRQLCSAVGGVWPRLTASLLSSIVCVCVCVCVQAPAFIRVYGSLCVSMPVPAYVHVCIQHINCGILACLSVIASFNRWPSLWYDAALYLAWVKRDDEKHQ